MYDMNEAIRRRFMTLLLTDQKVELKGRESAMELHHMLSDIRSLETEYYDAQATIEAFEEEMTNTRSNIDELSKELAKNEIEIIRLNQKIARYAKKTTAFQERDLALKMDASDEQLDYKRNMKLCLIRRCTGIVLDDRTSDRMTSGFSLNRMEVETIDIPHDERSFDITNGLWKVISENSTHFNEYKALFENAI